MADLGMVRILGRAAACVVADVVAGARDVAVDYLAALRVDLPTGVGDYDGPVGEYPNLPNVPAPAPVPGGGSPAAAGDHPTSALLDAAAHRLASMTSGRACHSDALDDLITELYERAEKFRAFERGAAGPRDLSGGASKREVDSPAKRSP